MRYRLSVDDIGAYRVGPFDEIRAAVADLITTLLASHPVTFAPDAQSLNMAFTGGAVEEALQERGEWSLTVGEDTPRPFVVKVTEED